MTFQDYKYNYFIGWHKHVQEKCWLIFAISTIMNAIVSVYFFITGSIARSDYPLYIVVQSVIPFVLQIVALIMVACLLRRRHYSTSVMNRISAVLFLWILIVTCSFHCRYEILLIIPGTSMILAGILCDKTLLKWFFVISFLISILNSLLWFVFYASSHNIMYNVTIVVLVLLVQIAIYFCSQGILQMQEDNMEMIFKGYIRQREMVRELRLEPLTRLYNRTAYAQAVNRIIKLKEKSQDEFYMALLDLDNFKSINDTYGHSAGDAVLIYLSELITRRLGNKRLAFRYGGDEFVILFRGQSRESVLEQIEDIRERFYNASFDFMHKDAHCSLSIGIAPYKEKYNSKEWFKRADDAAYKAKTSGKNCTIMED